MKSKGTLNRKICIITGTRAEYGQLYWLLRSIKDDDSLELQIIATGMHLSPEFGLTYKIIEHDGFFINEKVDMLLSSDSPVGIAKSIGLGVIGYAEALNRLKPDILVVTGDRYEMIAAAEAALVANIPVAHICGGEITEGAIDDSIRHALTKLSHLHFVREPEYKKRVIQLGEQPDRVFNVDFIGNDNFARLETLNLQELEDSLNFHLGDKFFLVTYHPVTLKLGSSESTIKNIIAALSKFNDHKILFTKANSDTDGRIINSIIDDYVNKNSNSSVVVTSLGQQRYISALKLCSAVVGNSSSGISEAPLFHKPTVNIGVRQKGRLRKPSVIDCGTSREEIENAIKEALSKQWKEICNTMSLPDMSGNVCIKTALYNI